MKSKEKENSVNSPNSANSVNSNEDLIAVALIVKTRGLRGETVANVLTDFPERFENLEKVFAVKPNKKIVELKLENFRFQKNQIVLKFAGIDSIEAAEDLRNAKICIPESEAVELEEDEFFDWELIDCAVETVEGEKIGTVREILRTGASEVLVVEGAEKEFLIPFVEAICTEVDVENKLIKIDAPEGLLDF